MSESRNSTNTTTTSANLQLWMDSVMRSPRMKYSIYFRELIQSLPKESALRLLRVRLQQEPRFAGMEVTELDALRRYNTLV